jgi:hypothetical protein
MCRFSDIATVPKSGPELLDAYLGSVGSAESYFNEVSVGRLSLAGTAVAGWFTLPEPRSGYVTGDSPNLAKVAQHCVAAANDQVDFRQYGGIAINVNGGLGCCAWGGSSRLQADGLDKFIPTIWMPNAIVGGIVWHELGHSFGLPHSGGPYGKTYDSQWDVMSASGSGVFLGQALGSAGPHFNAYHKNMLGLIPRARIVEVASGTQSMVLERSALATSNSNPVYVYVPFARRPGHGYTIEVRSRHGYDRAVPRFAVLIHSVVPFRAEWAQVVDSDGNGNPNDPGAAWTLGEVFEDTANGVRIAVDSITQNGFGITVTNGSTDAPQLSRGGASFEGDILDATWRSDSLRVLNSAWTARRTFRSSWLRLDRASGAAGDYLKFSVRASLVGPGRFVDTLVIEKPGTSVGTAFVVEFGVSGTASTPRLSHHGASRVIRANTAICDSVTISLPPGSPNLSWTASTLSPRVRLAAGFTGCFSGSQQASGVGSGVVRFSHFHNAVAGAVVVDTINVSVAGVTGTLTFVDSLESPQVAVLSLAGAGGRRSLLLGQVPPLDSVRVTSSTTMPGAKWFTSLRRNTTSLSPTSGLSGDFIRWSHPTSFAYTAVDSIRACDLFSVTCSPLYIDTMVVSDAPAELRVTRRSSASGTLRRGIGMRTDSASVELIGSTMISKAWTAAAKSLRISFHARDAFTPGASGTGTAWLKWTYDVSKLSPGTYVDTIVVRADGVPGSPAIIVDTLRLEPAREIAGDVDADGAVLTGDAYYVLRSLVGLPVPAGVRISPNGDANCDGQVTATDAMMMMQADLGIQPAGGCLGRPLVAALIETRRVRPTRPSAPPNPTHD